MPSQFTIAAPAPVRPLPPVPSQLSLQTLAGQHRACRRLTGHARKRAAALRLTVDIENARNLDHKQVSVIPLPVLDIVPSPVAPQQVGSHAKELKRKTTRPVLRCSIPQVVVNKGESSALSSMSLYSTVSLYTPDVIVTSEEVDAPVVLRGQNAETSRWSISTADDFEEGVMEDDDDLYSSDYEEGMDLPISAAEEYDDLFEEKPVVDARDNARLAPRLDIPVDVSRFSWGSALTSDYGSSSASCSPGPVTPAEEIPKLMIRIKRKSVASDIDIVDETLEKRPKYERKAWANPKRGSPQKIAAAPRKF
ncbi:hypothetical protein M413DRAFT_29710 [Hebeloma cylindrosporum]|uniref:Uncharacterized protein n=1 Tax=Hebeloma cylindrosporum TaxID=76867 RepID=A0A0C3C6F8_HEBCY|nr:hypothetical protein M413DRAFT_29710 [Hebeloma cylindrosporum h7]